MQDDDLTDVILRLPTSLVDGLRNISVINDQPLVTIIETALTNHVRSEENPLGVKTTSELPLESQK